MSPMPILELALKDLKLLMRDRLAAFFILGFPIVMGIFFGVVMGGSSSSEGRGKMELAVIDQDQSEISKKFVAALGENENLRLVTDSLEGAKESVRLGKRAGLVVLPPGFGEKAGLMWEPQPEIQLGMDPSRAAESAMMEGFIMQATASLIAERFQQPQQFLPSITAARDQLQQSDASPQTKLLAATFFGSLETMIGLADQMQQADAENTLSGAQLQFANIKPLDVTRKVEPDSIQAQLTKLRSRWDISFPQAMLWGVLGCVAGFSISIARERSMGTMLRLQASPLNITQILLGKATACFLAVLLVIVVMVALGTMLQMRPSSFAKLAIAALATAVCFVGIMMTFAVLGKTEQSVSGIGWAANIVMAMIGGCMIPAMFLPGFLQKLSFVSPVRWGILALEGGIWRDFSWFEMALPCLVLVGIGIAGFLIGTTILRRQTL
jgi:ABC-2 type transport system permease protein